MSSMSNSKRGDATEIDAPNERLRLSDIEAVHHLATNIDASSALRRESVTRYRKAFALELMTQLHDMPMGESIIEKLRLAERY